MAKNRYLDIPEEIYFVSHNEHTLPAKETLLEKIEECIPCKYDIINHEAIYNRILMEKITIRYFINKIDPNRYKITISYGLEVGIFAYMLMIIGLVVGGSIGYSIFKEIGAVIGAMVGVIITASVSSQKDAEQVCDKIAVGIKEYERAHLLYTSK